jgi:hypothetical protein
MSGNWRNNGMMRERLRLPCSGYRPSGNVDLSLSGHRDLAGLALISINGVPSRRATSVMTRRYVSSSVHGAMRFQGPGRINACDLRYEFSRLRKYSPRDER